MNIIKIERENKGTIGTNHKFILNLIHFEETIGDGLILIKQSPTSFCYILSAGFYGQIIYFSSQ